MKTAITFGIDFIIRLKEKQKDKTLLYARITVNGDRKELSLKQEINTREWDTNKEMLEGSPRTQESSIVTSKTYALD